jgi:hypothetical protein
MGNEPAAPVHVVVGAGKPRRDHLVQATHLIHEHFGTIMSFVYSRLPLEQLVQDKFTGEWKYLQKALLQGPRERAQRALIELGLYIRLIDDSTNKELSELRYWDGTVFGDVVSLDGSRKPLLVREVANKIIHAEEYKWGISAAADPTVVCVASQDQVARFKWISASIDLVALGSFCGSLMG